MSEACILCNNALVQSYMLSNTTVYVCECPNCGEYEITHQAKMVLPNMFQNGLNDSQHNISGYVRELNDTGQNLIRITTENIVSIANIANSKATLSHKMNRLLHKIYEETTYFGEALRLEFNELALCYARNSDEMRNMIKALGDAGYIVAKSFFDGGSMCTLTVYGFNYIDKLLKTNASSNLCFIGMWFDNEMINTFSSYISRAVIDTGFEPFITKNKEHNDDICDEIVAGIKKSKFMIADFTGQRPSVYYEAGIAFGLGIPVIWTCREDWFNNQVAVQKEVTVEGKKVIGEVNENRFVHFDVSHNKFIIWKDGQDLYQKLVNRIEATIK